jgi:beta-glucosidase
MRLSKRFDDEGEVHPIVRYTVELRPPDDPAAGVPALVAALSVAEKIAFLHQHQPAVERLGLAPFHTGCEALHGVAWIGRATVFPQAVGLGATWDRDLVRRVGEAVSVEVRAFGQDPAATTASGRAEQPTMVSLNVWAPVVNPLRDPRWGRNEEGYSEDPYATAELAIAYCTGLRGPDPAIWRTAPVLKHFLAYNVETDRDTVDVVVPARVLHEYELPAFRGPIEAGVVAGVMPAYNLVNGVPNHVHPLLREALRSWDPDLVICSDAHAPTNLAESEKYFPDHVQSHAAALRAGLDSYTDNGDDPAPTIARFTAALAAGLVSQADIDAAVGRVLALRARTGEFDPGRDPYAGIRADVIAGADHAALAGEAARASIVLLRNENGALPWTASTMEEPGAVAVIGPLGDEVLRDWYSGTLPYRVSIADGLRTALGAGAVRAVSGADRVELRITATGTPVTVTASDAGAALLADDAGPPAVFEHRDWGTSVQCPVPVHTLRATGTGRYLSLDDNGTLVDDATTPDGWTVEELWEFHPSGPDTLLYANATKRYVAVRPDGRLVADAGSAVDATRFTVTTVHSGRSEAVAVAGAARSAVVVLGNDPHINGRETVDRDGLALPPEQAALLRDVYAANPNTVLVLVSSYPYAIGPAAVGVPAILWTSHAGQEIGSAVADVLLGRYNPGGRLPQTWYADGADLPDPRDYDIIGSQWTYQYSRRDHLFPFGHGLSYTTFGYSDLRLDPTADGVTVTVSVTNTGPVAGDEVVQLYARALDPPVPMPLRRLHGFERFRSAPGETRTITFTVPDRALGYWSVELDRLVREPGRYEFLVGPSSQSAAVREVLELP